MSDPVPRLRRLLTMIPLVRRSNGITVDELARLLKATRREIVSDLDKLMLCGVPPYQPHDYISVLIDGDRIQIDYADHFERPAALTLHEALALRLALESLPRSDDELGHARDELAGTLEKLLRDSKGVDGLSRELDGRVAATASSETSRKLTQLREAVRRRRPVEIVYYSASSEATKPRLVRPYGTGEDGGNHYLVAHDVAKNDVRHFRVDRIASILEPKDQPPFTLPGDFDLTAFMKRGFGPRSGQPIRIWFAKTVARFVREDYDGYPMETLPSGDVILELQAGSLTWAVSRALAFGEHAEVLSPPEARAEARRRLEAALAAPPGA